MKAEQEPTPVGAEEKPVEGEQVEGEQVEGEHVEGPEEGIHVYLCWVF